MRVQTEVEVTETKRKAERETETTRGDGKFTYLRTDLQGKQMMHKECKNDEFQKSSRHRERHRQRGKQRERESE